MALDGRNQYPSPHSKAYLALKAVPDRFKQEYDSFLPLRSARLISPSHPATRSPRVDLAVLPTQSQHPTIFANSLSPLPSSPRRPSLTV